jgi:hypothetical protein
LCYFGDRLSLSILGTGFAGVFLFPHISIGGNPPKDLVGKPPRLWKGPTHNL